jgi:hypothetical protein
MLRHLAFWVFTALPILLSKVHGYNSSYNDGIHLAIFPTCGKLVIPATNVTNVNAGLTPLSSYKTIVSFGDSYTSGGYANGSTLPPPVLIPPNPQAGGRVTDGRVWIEDISVDTRAVFMDYAVRIISILGHDEKIHEGS